MKPKSADLQNAPNCGKRTERIRIQFESAAGLMSTEEQGLMESTQHLGRRCHRRTTCKPHVENLKEQLKVDSVCPRVMTLCSEGWPAHAKQEPVLKNDWQEQATLRERRLIAERHKACYTCCHEERCVSKTA